jgi:ATP-dependent RNA helicase DDX42
VKQIVKVMSVGGSKWNWLLEHLIEFTSAGSVLIFVTKKANCEELAHNLKAKEFEVRLLHGDLNQVNTFFA